MILHALFAVLCRELDVIDTSGHVCQYVGAPVKVCTRNESFSILRVTLNVPHAWIRIPDASLISLSLSLSVSLSFQEAADVQEKMSALLDSDEEDGAILCLLSSLLAGF